MTGQIPNARISPHFGFWVSGNARICPTPWRQWLRYLSHNLRDVGFGVRAYLRGGARRLRRRPCLHACVVMQVLETLPHGARPVHLVQGAGCRAQGSGFRVQGAGLRVQGSGFRVQGSGFKVQCSGVRVQGSGFRVQGPTDTQHCCADGDDEEV